LMDVLHIEGLASLLFDQIPVLWGDEIQDAQLQSWDCGEVKWLCSREFEGVFQSCARKTLNPWSYRLGNSVTSYEIVDTRSSFPSPRCFTTLCRLVADLKCVLELKLGCTGCINDMLMSLVCWERM
jgi:hypothetical protein